MKNKKNLTFENIFNIILICCMIFIIVLWGKHFPLMKYRGYKKLYKYMDIQKIPKKDIKDIKSYKDIKFDGYFYYVYLKDYPNYTLCYEYTREGKFFLAVEKEINGINNMLDENELKNFKYKPLPDNWEDIKK